MVPVVPPVPPPRLPEEEEPLLLEPLLPEPLLPDPEEPPPRPPPPPPPRLFSRSEMGCGGIMGRGLLLEMAFEKLAGRRSGTARGCLRSRSGMERADVRVRRLKRWAVVGRSMMAI